ncbi:hypothetical protein QLQ80_02725 [Mycoplasma sp. M5725]|uniref:Uncharacterized protein n=1 Tax=Mycoplasma phocimorsus TaxID=3045839 RepID=A0AAJ1PUA6_9MOLU|nr:hypothetical protein [Mycoplasma phocimorsus]MDJ1645980.1 hypothetical protein [Mycoplasma phocimorsus]
MKKAFAWSSILTLIIIVIPIVSISKIKINNNSKNTILEKKNISFENKKSILKRADYEEQKYEKILEKQQKVSLKKQSYKTQKINLTKQSNSFLKTLSSSAIPWKTILYSAFGLVGGACVTYGVYEGIKYIFRKPKGWIINPKNGKNISKVYFSNNNAFLKNNDIYSNLAEKKENNWWLPRNGYSTLYVKITSDNNENTISETQYELKNDMWSLITTQTDASDDYIFEKIY